MVKYISRCFMGLMLFVFCFTLAPLYAVAQNQISPILTDPAARHLANISQVLTRYEMGLSYLEYCDDLDKQLAKHKNFKRGVQAVIFEMTRVAKQYNKNTSKRTVVREIQRKRNEIANLVDQKLRHDGCQSLFAYEAKAFFEDLREIPPEDVIKKLPKF